MAARKSDVKYEDDVKPRLEEIKAWAKQGLIDPDIWYNLGISKNSFYRWKNNHREFREALRVGKAVANKRVENALYQRATGYEYDEVTEEVIGYKEDGEPIKRVKATTKHQPPDTTAQIFWLKNRDPEKWRDRQELDVNGNLTIKRWEDINKD
jgi:hypothetical protein